MVKDCSNNKINKFYIFVRLINLFFIFLYNIISFYSKNFIYYYFTKLPKNERLELVKSIAYKLEELNIAYLKIFQSLCLEKVILYDNEKEYLLKYTDNVPYKNEELDYELLNLIQSKYNIKLEESQPINSGIVGVVFKGLDGNNNNSKVVIKMLKNNIEKNLNTAFIEIEYLTYMLCYIPFLNNLNLHKLFLDNKESLLNQVNFVKEVTNIEIFKLKNINESEYKIPYVYKEITNDHKNVIVMENIKGLTINDIKDYDSSIKEEFGKLFVKFGLKNLFYTGAIHCDLHAGNIFFYINDNNSLLPKYQLGLIDFGLCCFPNKNEQNLYYLFFTNYFYKKDFSNKKEFSDVIKNIIHDKEKYDNMCIKTKKKLFLDLENTLKASLNRDFDITFCYNLLHTLKKYKLNVSSQFNQICLSLCSSNSLGKKLCNSVTKTQLNYIEELIKINKLIEI